MKKIEAIFKPFKLDEIKEVLAKERIPRRTPALVGKNRCVASSVKNSGLVQKRT